MRAVRERTRRPQEAQPPQPGASLLSRLFDPVDSAALAYFRVAFGSLMLIEIFRFFAHAWIQSQFIQPPFHFGYFGFEWVRPWPDGWMLAHFAVLGVLAGLIVLGLWYRVATTLFFLGLSYVFLLESARYLNHFYLMVLFAFLMILVPAHRAFSLDARRRPETRSRVAPAWALWILRFQMGVVYLYGGIAKINEDWLVRAEPLREFLSRDTSFPIIGGLFEQEWLIYLFAWGSMLLDLLAFPLLMWRRSRPFAFAGLAAFHLMNSQLFSIGIFPWLALAATALFFDPSWPRRLFAGSRSTGRVRRARKVQARALTVSGLGTGQRVTIAMLALYVAIQVLVPLRHFAYAGEVSWTEEGHRYSWRMMLRDKPALARFFVTSPETGETFEADPSEHVTGWQYKAMSSTPYLILQFAHRLAEVNTPPGGPPPEVRAHVVAVLNSRPAQLLVDPRVNLAGEEYGLGTVDWIVPLGDDFWVPPPGSDAPSLEAYAEEATRSTVSVDSGG